MSEYIQKYGVPTSGLDDDIWGVNIECVAEQQASLAATMPCLGNSLTLPGPSRPKHLPILLIFLLDIPLAHHPHSALRQNNLALLLPSA